MNSTSCKRSKISDFYKTAVSGTKQGGTGCGVTSPRVPWSQLGWAPPLFGRLLKLGKRKQATGCWHSLQGWEGECDPESGASLVCVGSSREKPRHRERCWARNFTSHLHWGRDNGVGSQPQPGDGCSAMGLERRRELQRLFFPPSGWKCTAWLLVSAPFISKGQFWCVFSLPDGGVQKKAWKHEGGRRREKHVPAWDVGKPDFWNCCQLLENRRV